MSKNESVDIFAMLNPALGAVIIRKFLDGFEEIKEDGCFLDICYLILPIILSKKNNKTFGGTNKKTGLITWISRNSNIKVDLELQIKNTVEYSKESIIFAIQKNIILIDSNGNLFANKNLKLKSSKNRNMKLMFSNSNRIGYWFGEMKEEKDIFYYLGVKL